MFISASSSLEMFLNAYHVLSICQSQLGLEFDRLPCLTLSILTTCASAHRVPRMNVLKYDTCCVRLSKIKAYPTRQSDLTSATHIFLWDVFPGQFHHFAASRLRSTTFQRAKIHNLLALTGHSWQHLVWIEDVHTGTHAHFPVELLVKQAAPRQRCDGK